MNHPEPEPPTFYLAEGVPEAGIPPHSWVILLAPDKFGFYADRELDEEVLDALLAAAQREPSDDRKMTALRALLEHRTRLNARQHRDAPRRQHLQLVF